MFLNDEKNEKLHRFDHFRQKKRIISSKKFGINDFFLLKNNLI